MTTTTKKSNLFYGILSMPATAMGFALCVQIAALSWILNTKYGLNIEEIGKVWLAGPLAGILGQLIAGAVSDQVWLWGGRRRPFIIIGGTIAGLMILALPYLDVIQAGMGLESLVGVALTVALTLDLAINISFNPARSIIADVTEEGEARTKGFTWMQTISGFFGVLAYLMGAFINNYFLIYFGAAFVLLTAVVPAFFIEEPRELTKAAVAEGRQTTSTDWWAFLKICGAHAFTWVGVQTMFIYSFAYIKEVIMGFETAAELTTEQNNEIGFSIGVAFAILNTVGFILPSQVLEPLARK
ncbi:MAG: MFS transporter, partial [Bacteroidota bacterium]